MTMKVHHLNCATMCPRGGGLLGASGGPLAKAKLVCHCLLIEAGDTLVLVDTGLGTGDARNPKRLGQPFRAVVAPQCLEEETAIRRIEALGLDPADVGHVVLTHMDLDHAGGLSDFPDAEVHVYAPELAISKAPPLRQKARYIQDQWAHGPKWVPHEVEGDSWFGFESVSLLDGVDAEIAMVPLVGHSAGHAGIAVNTPGGWLLHCGDAYFHHGEMETPRRCPAGLKIFQTIMQHEGATRHSNQERLRDLVRGHSAEVRTVCAHDATELEREQAR